MKNGRIEAKKIFKTLGDMEGNKLTTLKWCTGQVIMSILTLLDFDRYLVFI